MDKTVAPILTLNALTDRKDFKLGSVFVSPARRLLEGPGGTTHLQPQVMLVFLCLADQQDFVVARHLLFDRCWGGAPVGDDSINRAIAAIRQALETIGAEDLSLETIPRTGYRLVATNGATSDHVVTQALDRAYDCWRAGLPEPDTTEASVLEDVLAATSGDARAWGVLALILRKAAEYSGAGDCAGFVSRCEHAARRALTLDENEPNARIALTGLAPLFGNWSSARIGLTEILAGDPAHVPALHELAVLEMATGRPAAAASIVEMLLARDPLAATFHYKRMYHLWTLGRFRDAETVAARALALWPKHPAIWMARFWILLFTERPEQALRLVCNDEERPRLTGAMIEFLARGAELVAARSAGDGRSDDISDYICRAIEVASVGPANAVAALTMLCAFDAIDEIFDVAYSYYLGRGRAATPLRWNAGDPSITDQHRRVTQLLFIPAATKMREDGRFLPLCEEIGLSAYWDEFDLTPDFLQ
ncbi:MAG TPA: winged helix-turn-helix domain-containing protein [Sphingomicrobium sp.]|nr:winged helix-turn-helix domain-containing protein [Sphingomicrobium sp.]